jgi:hypothetical protein
LSETSQNQGHQEETKKEFQNDFFVVPKNSKEEDDLELVQISSVENECSINLPEMKSNNIELDFLGDLPSGIPNIYNRDISRNLPNSFKLEFSSSRVFLTGSPGRV